MINTLSSLAISSSKAELRASRTVSEVGVGFGSSAGAGLAEQELARSLLPAAGDEVRDKAARLVRTLSMLWDFFDLCSVRRLLEDL